nr:PREDICTED: cilia- and flagella-associated protein 58-like [Bemisia tabaci]
MKRIVCARKSTLKLMAALKTAGEKHLSSSKEDNLAQELESEYNQLVDHYEKTVESLRGNKTTAQYESDFTMFWNFITKAHDHQKRLWMKCKDLQHLASLNSNKLSSALKNAQSGQESVEELKKALEAAWLTVDTTNAREQVAQETIEALRLQVGKLKSELDMKNRMLQSETDGPAMKNKEMLAREKERSQTEVMNLKQKLEVIKSQQAELESKKTSTENKVQELLVDIENKDSELAREVRLRQGVEEELKKANKKILTLNDEVTQLNSQLELTKKAVAEIETNLKQVTAINEHIVQKNEALSTSLIKAQTDLQNKSVSHDAANQRIAALVTQMKMLDEDLRKVNGELRKTNKMRDTFQRRIQESEAKNNLLVQDRERLRLRLVDVERERDIIIKEKEQEIKARKALVVELEVVNNNLLKATAANYEEAKNRKIQEQQKKEAELILESAREELNKLKVAHNTIEKDKEK